MQKFGVFFILGGPGAGKGTVCQKIAESYNMIHLSAGDILRREMNESSSEFASIIEDYIKRGAIVPVEITCSLLHKAMIAGYTNRHIRNYLIDGFPRNEDNKSGWERTMSTKANILQVFVIDCSEDLCINRCLSRGCGRIDDNVETLKRRFSMLDMGGKRDFLVFAEKSHIAPEIAQFNLYGLPVIEFYGQKNLVSHIDGSKTRDEVLGQVQKVMDRILGNQK